MNQLGFRQGQCTIRIDQQVAVRRRDVNGARAQPIAILGLFDREAALSAQQLGHQAAMTRIEMLDDGDGRYKICGQARQDARQGTKAASGRGNRYDVESGPGMRPPHVDGRLAGRGRHGG